MYERQDVVHAPRVQVYSDEADEKQMVRTFRRLQDRFGPAVDAELLEVRVREHFGRFESAQVREFVPILVEREIRREFGRRPEAS